MAEADGGRYRFPPLERRGVIAGITGTQLAVAGGGCVAALLTLRILPGAAGAAGAFAVITAGLAGACWNVAGRTPGGWLPVMAAWARRRARGPGLTDLPRTGTTRNGPARPAPPPALAGVSLTEAREVPGEPSMGVVCDLKAGTMAAMLVVHGRSFSLLDPGEKQRRLDVWGGVLAALCREGSPVQRVQWVERTMPGRRDGLRSYLDLASAAAPGDTRPTRDAGAARDTRDAGAAQDTRDAGAARDTRDAGDARDTRDAGDARDTRHTRDAGDARGAQQARQSYAELIACAGPVGQSHSVLVVLAVNQRRSARSGRSFGRGRAAVFGVLRREIRLLQGQLRQADLTVDGVLSTAEVAVALRAGFDPGSVPPAPPAQGARPGAGGSAWPMGVDENWAWVRVDGSWHATYWVADWPRLDVGPDFLSPLLLSAAGLRAASVVMAPIPPARAAREVEAARTADMADEQLRQKAGFLTTARRQRAAEGVIRRESELADGHAEFRYSGYVTVSASSEAELSASCAEVEQAARQANLELRRLYGQQLEAFTWTLPLARGLR